ncbi:alpha-L-arabinofuranosidase C-terminal domain-containing protein [Niabella aquatica]
MIKKLLFCVAAIVAGYVGNTQELQFDVNVKAVKGKINPNMWGVFFEDINMGADGGIYAEMIKNRSFEFYKPLMGWTPEGTGIQEGDMQVLNRGAQKTSNPRFLRVNVSNAGKGAAALVNEGFRGMGFKEGLKYTFSVMYQQVQPGVKIYLELLNDQGNVIGSADLVPQNTGKGWHQQSVELAASQTVLKGKFRVGFTGNGVIDLDMLSLFPQDTWKNRPGGLRADMVQKLADMKPGFIRFPGGCIVEGHDLSVRYQWKKTIGPVEERELIVNRWNTEFAHRPTPDYYQTFGLGFFEYFQLAEDIGAEPLPILNCGMACQFNTAELVPMDQMAQYVQDALDLIEFANGAVTTKWGKVRNDMGHPAPFHLKMLGVGNENWGPQYVERLKLFEKAIKAKYPEIKLVYSSGTDPDGERFEYLNGELRKLKADIIDEHYYRVPEWFVQNVNRYDHYDRNGPKIFAGEYAAQSDKTVSPDNKNNWKTAISEAAFLTGLERNADVVCMASYAPLFAHVDGWQWTPDLIWVDNLNVYGTPNYYVQQLFSLNKGTDIVPLTANGSIVDGKDNLFASAVVDAATGEVVIKIVNYNPSAREVAFAVQGVKSLARQASVTVLATGDLEKVNSIAKPKEIAPVTTNINLKGRKIQTTLAPYSLTVLRCKYK